MATTGLPKANDADLRQARVMLLECGKAALLRLDDGISPAGTIASAMAMSCKSESDGYFDLVTQEKPEPLRNEVKRQALQGKNFIPMVLQYRASQRQKI